jgi:hypothetical protein
MSLLLMSEIPGCFIAPIKRFTISLLAVQNGGNMNKLLIYASTHFVERLGRRSLIAPIVPVLLLWTIGISTAAVPPPAPEHSVDDVILQWNRILGETVVIQGQQPPTIVAQRSYAMMHGAMFDAVNSIDGSYEAYLVDVPGSKNASIEAAAAQAAYEVLAALYPGRESIFAAQLEVSLAGLPENRVQQGIRVGHEAAAVMLADRANDGWAASPPPYVLLPNPGNWQPTPPAFVAAGLTHYPNVKPFALTSSLQFRPPPPPALASDEYALALNEVKAIGSVNSTTRTADQTQAARAWASIGNPTGVAVFWNSVARSLAVSRATTTVENARLFAMLNMSGHDGLQTSMASKYHYGLWRPVTAIRRADEDGNAATEPDPTWSSLITNPPYPTYAGNMASIGMANASVLTLFFGRDDLAGQYTFPTTPTPVTRSWASLSAIADEAARSREYGGIHFRFDSVAGQSIGLNTGNYIFFHLMTPR